MFIVGFNTRDSACVVSSTRVLDREEAETYELEVTVSYNAAAGQSGRKKRQGKGLLECGEEGFVVEKKSEF